MRRWIILTALASFSLTSLSQIGDLRLDGLVYGNNGIPLKQARVVWKDAEGTLFQERETPNNGSFTFIIPAGKEAYITFQKPGYATKQMIVNTKDVTGESLNYGYEYGGFRVTLQEGDWQRPAQNVAVIRFDPESGNFKHYTE